MIEGPTPATAIALTIAIGQPKAFSTLSRHNNHTGSAIGNLWRCSGSYSTLLNTSLSWEKASTIVSGRMVSSCVNRQRFPCSIMPCMGIISSLKWPASVATQAAYRLGTGCMRNRWHQRRHSGNIPTLFQGLVYTHPDNIFHLNRIHFRVSIQFQFNTPVINSADRVLARTLRHIPPSDRPIGVRP